MTHLISSYFVLIKTEEGKIFLTFYNNFNIFSANSDSVFNVSAKELRASTYFMVTFTPSLSRWIC